MANSMHGVSSFQVRGICMWYLYPQVRRVDNILWLVALGGMPAAVLVAPNLLLMGLLLAHRAGGWTTSCHR